MTRWRWITACALATSLLAAAEPDWPTLETHALDLPQRYVRIESVNPPANTRAAAALFKAELERNGFEPKIYESGPAGQTNLVVRLPGRDRTKKPLLLLNHFDVVPVDRKAWTIDPFAAIIRDGFLWGRGALDMKGIGVEHLTALIALRQAGIMPARDIVMLSTADEETNGTYGIEWMIANHFDEIDCEYALDEGGLLTREVLARGKLIFGVSVGEKQVLWLRLHAKGTAGHGSQPIADNANLILLEAIGKALAQPERPKGNAVVEEMIRAAGGPLSPNKFSAAIQHNTISLTTLSAGVGNPPKVNVIPSSSEATLDCRLLPGVNADEFVSEIKARINDPRVQVERIASSPDTGASSSKTPLFEAIRTVVKRQVPDAILTPMLVPFATDSIKLRARGIVAYGITPMELDAATAATMHSDQERIPVEQFKKGIHFFFDVLRSDF